MSAVTESDVRRIVREEIADADRLRQRTLRQASIEQAEYSLSAANRSALDHPASPGSLVDTIQGMRRDAAEQGLADALLADVSSDLLDGVPEVIDLSRGAVAAGFPALEPLTGLDASSAVSSAAHLLDGVDKVVAHDSSSRVPDQVLDTPVVVDGTLEDAADDVSSRDASAALPTPAVRPVDDSPVSAGRASSVSGAA